MTLENKLKRHRQLFYQKDLPLPPSKERKSGEKTFSLEVPKKAKSSFSSLDYGPSETVSWRTLEEPEKKQYPTEKASFVLEKIEPTKESSHYTQRTQSQTMEG